MSQRTIKNLSLDLATACDRAENGKSRMRSLETLLSSAIHSKDELGNIKVSAEALEKIISLYKALENDIDQSQIRSRSYLDKMIFSDEQEG